MPYVALLDAEIQSGEPISQSLVQKIKENFDDHEARIAGGGGGGSVSGGGDVLNGSLEADADADGVPDNFLVSYYPGGTGGFDTADYVHGTKSWRFDLNGGANTGGGYLETDYIFVNRFYCKPIWLAYKAESTSGIPRVQVIARCFDRNKAYLGEVTIWDTVTHLSGWNLAVIHNITLSFIETEYVKYRLVGGAVDAAGVVGSVWFDAIGIEGYRMQVTVPESINQPDVAVSMGGWSAAGSVFNINIPAGKFQWLVVPVRAIGTLQWVGESEASYPTRIRCYIDSAYSTVVESPTNQWVTGNCLLYIGGMAGAKQLRFQASGADSYGWYWGGQFGSPSSFRKFYATNFRDVDHGAGTETNTYVKPAV
jgi:hypothetical protein